MRVIAGSARRLLLTTPAGMDTRPTTDQIKETLFNMLNPYLADCEFLDLFAGSGGIGIEALSRGAKHACFVEHGREALNCIRNNLTHTHLDSCASVYGMDFLAALDRMKSEHRRFDVIFMDPPYGRGLEVTALTALKQYGLLNDDALIVVEASKETPIDEISGLGYTVRKIKEYKSNRHWFLEETVSGT